jgi:hypothetical protein
MNRQKQLCENLKPSSIAFGGVSPTANDYLFLYIVLNISKLTLHKTIPADFLKVNKFAPVRAEEAYNGNEGIAPLILNLGPIWSIVVSLNS